MMDVKRRNRRITTPEATHRHNGQACLNVVSKTLVGLAYTANSSWIKRLEEEIVYVL